MQDKPAVVYATVDFENVWPAKTHGIREQKIARLHVTGLFHSFRDNPLGRSRDEHGLIRIANLDPVDSVRFVREKCLNRAR